MTDNSHLNRTAICRRCRWAGITARLLVEDVPGFLRCPKCDSQNIYVGPELRESEKLRNLEEAIFQ